MKKLTVILLILAFASLIALIASVTSVVYFKSMILKTDVIPMDIAIGDHIGLNVNNSMLHFGMATPGGSSKRFMKLENKYSFKIKVAFQTYGDMAQWVQIINSSVVLRPNESRKVTFAAKIPNNVSFGNYTGYAKIIFKRS